MVLLVNEFLRKYGVERTAVVVEVDQFGAQNVVVEHMTCAFLTN